MPTQEQPVDARAARKRSNLAFALVSLEKPRRLAMETFYDFCRLVDDIADEPVRDVPRKYAELRGWREEICSWKTLWGARRLQPSAFLEGGVSAEPNRAMANALRGVCETYAVEPQDLLDLLEGVAHDVEPRAFADFEALRRYCYGVASAVGMVSIKIFGCKHPNSRAYAEALGYALQFTNILRDIREDFEEKGRVYLPQDELAHYGVTPEILCADAPHAGRAQLLALQYFRAKHYFNRARRLLTPEDKDALVAARVMSALYETILERVRASAFSLKKRARLSKPRKIALLLKTLRDAKKAPLPKLRPPCRAAVFGAGVSGMSAAALLAFEGFDVALYEAKKIAGGRACAFDDSLIGARIDNGQHAIFGCYEKFLGIVSLLGAEPLLEKARALDVVYVDRGGTRAALKAPNLPFGLGMAVALLRFKKLKLRDKWGVMRLALALRRGRALPSANETAAQWLARLSQTKNACDALWTPFCVAALNQQPETASAKLLCETLRRALFGKPKDAAVYLTRVPLGDLIYPNLARFLQSIGSSATLGAQVSEIAPENGGVRYCVRGQTERADIAVCAMNAASLAAQLPEGELRRNLAAVRTAGIVNAHIVCDTRLFKEPFVGFLDSPVHWMFDRTELLPEAERARSRLYAITISAPDALLDAPSADVLALIERELRSHFPQAENARILRARLVKTRDATFAATPQTEAMRPHCTAAAPLLIAGDFTATNLPATLESAAQSAYDCLRALDNIL